MERFRGDSTLEAKRAFRGFPHDRLFLRDALSRADGNLFVDRLPDPTVWLLRNQQRDTSFIVGECPTTGFIPEVAASLQTDQWGPCLSLPSESWQQSLSDRFGELFYFGEPMITFQNLDPTQFRAAETLSQLSGEFKVVQLAVRHLEQIRPRGWADPKHFIEQSVGFGVVDGIDQIASYALSNFVLEDAVEVAVETEPEYRRRGFARLAASALLSFSISKGLAPQWTSWAGNLEACSLARKLGFRDEHPHAWAFVRPRAQN
jgi:GNAT superfamily N-acetyltransferase